MTFSSLCEELARDYRTRGARWQAAHGVLKHGVTIYGCYIQALREVLPRVRRCRDFGRRLNLKALEFADCQDAPLSLPEALAQEEAKELASYVSQEIGTTSSESRSGNFAEAWARAGERKAIMLEAVEDELKAMQLQLREMVRETMDFLAIALSLRMKLPELTPETVEVLEHEQRTEALKRAAGLSYFATGRLDTRLLHNALSFPEKERRQIVLTLLKEGPELTALAQSQSIDLNQVHPEVQAQIESLTELLYDISISGSTRERLGHNCNGVGYMLEGQANR